MPTIGTHIRLMRPASVAQSETPSRQVGSDCVSVFVAAGGVIVLQERRPDGTPGVEWHIPPDEFTDDMVDKFVRGVQRKQARGRISIVR